MLDIRLNSFLKQKMANRVNDSKSYVCSFFTTFILVSDEHTYFPIFIKFNDLMTGSKNIKTSKTGLLPIKLKLKIFESAG